MNTHVHIPYVVALSLALGLGLAVPDSIKTKVELALFGPSSAEGKVFVGGYDTYYANDAANNTFTGGTFTDQRLPEEDYHDPGVVQSMEDTHALFVNQVSRLPAAEEMEQQDISFCYNTTRIKMCIAEARRINAWLKGAQRAASSAQQRWMRGNDVESTELLENGNQFLRQYHRQRAMWMNHFFPEGRLSTSIWGA